MPPLRLFSVLLLLALTTLTASRPCCSSPEGEADGWAPRRAGRALQWQQVQQCTWRPDSGCALNPVYAVSKLGDASGTPAGQRLGRSLLCATITLKGSCEATEACAWDSSFQDGEHGCFVQPALEAAPLSACAKQRYAAAVAKLHQCMTSTGSCQCAAAAASNSSTCSALLEPPPRLPAQLRGRCSSVLGCWLASVEGAAVDVTQLVQVHLVSVLPGLDALRSWQAGPSRGGVAATGRRRLLQPSMTGPLDDEADAGDALGGGGGGGGGGDGSTLPLTGQNLPLPESFLAKFTVTLPGGASASVVADGPILSAAGSSFTPESSQVRLESGVLGAPSAMTRPTTGGGGGGGDDSMPGSGGSGGGGGGGGRASPAPQPFWQCVATAAAAANAQRVWEAAQQAAMPAAAFDAFASAAAPLQALDFGVAALACFKGQAPFSAAVAPMAEAYDLTLVQLTRVVTQSRDLFRQYVAGGGGPAAAADVLHTALNSIMPDAVIRLQSAYAGGGAYAQDVVAEAQAVLTGMQWFARELGYVVSEDPAAAPVAVQAQMHYTARTVLRVLQWLLSVQFDAPLVAAPAQPSPTPPGAALAGGLRALAAAYLPSQGLALDDPAWVQSSALLVDAANAAAAATLAAPPRAGNATALSRLALDALAAAHVHDLWARRVPAANGASGAAALAAAVADRSTGRSWSGLVGGQVSVLRGVAGVTAAAARGDAAALAGYAWRDAISEGQARFLAGVAESANPALAQGSVDAERLLLAVPLANATALCGGGAAAAAPAPAPDVRVGACASLARLSEALLQQALPDVQQADPVYQGAKEALRLQWRCAALAPGAACAADAACAVGVLPPGSTAQGAARLACAASNTALPLRLAWDATLAHMAASPSCAASLALPECSAVADRATCAAFPACRWRAADARPMVSMAEGDGVNGSSNRSVCTVSWGQVAGQLEPRTLQYFHTHARECAQLGDSGLCGGLVLQMDGALEAPPGQGGAAAHVWAPVVACVLALALVALAGVVAVRRRRAAAREAEVLAHRLEQRKRKGGDKKRVWKSKIKRAAPGSHQPDLMRDSFTDYLAVAPLGGGAFSDAPEDGGSMIGVGSVAGGRWLGDGGSSVGLGSEASALNPLNALHEEIGARLRLAAGVGLGAVRIGAMQQLLHGSSGSSGSSSGSSVGGGSFVSGAGGARPGRGGGGGGGSASEFGFGGGASLARISTGSSSAGSSASARGAPPLRSLRQRQGRPGGGADAGGDAGGAGAGDSCHDSVRTCGSGAATPALSLSRESWNSADLLVSPHVGHLPGPVDLL